MRSTIGTLARGVLVACCMTLVLLLWAGLPTAAPAGVETTDSGSAVFNPRAVAAQEQRQLTCELRKKINAGKGQTFSVEACSTKTADDLAREFNFDRFFENFCASKLGCAQIPCDNPRPGDRCVVEMLETPSSRSIKCDEVDDPLADCLFEGEKKFLCTVKIREGNLRCGCKCERVLTDLP